MLNFSRILSILFLVLGGILGLYGYFTQGDTMYAISLGKNINLIWGLVLMGAGTIFGIFSLFPD